MKDRGHQSLIKNMGGKKDKKQTEQYCVKLICCENLSKKTPGSGGFTGELYQTDFAETVPENWRVENSFQLITFWSQLYSDTKSR